LNKAFSFLITDYFLCSGKTQSLDLLILKIKTLPPPGGGRAGVGVAKFFQCGGGRFSPPSPKPPHLPGRRLFNGPPLIGYTL
jgi:hypothetical protein